MSVLKIKDSVSGQWQGISSIQGEPGQKGETGGVNDAVKLALMQIVNHVYYDDERRIEYVQALQDALYPPADLVSLSAVYTPSGAVYDTAELDDLKADLVVTVTKTGGATQTIAAADYTLYGDLAIGSNTVSVIYRGLITTFDVTVVREPTGLVDGEYTTGNGLGGITVSDNRISYGSSQSTSYSYSIPLIKPIQLKAGDVVTFSTRDVSEQKTSAIGVGFNGSSLRAFHPLTSAYAPESSTIASDLAATSLFIAANGTMANTSFTFVLLVNGEEVIG